MLHRKRIAVWWIFPCKAISGVFRELAEMGFTIDVVFLNAMSADRVKLGWWMPDFGRATVRYLPQVGPERDEFLNQFPFADYDLHLVNGFYVNRESDIIVERLKGMKIALGVLTEAPFNGFFGLKRVMKYLYLALVVPFRGRKLASYALFVCCLSGAGAVSFRWLRWFGFRKDRIFPFGYFSEEPGEMRTDASEVGTPPLLVCTGYLTRNKGQLLLLQALLKLRTRGVEFRCVITGFGPERERLQAFIDRYQLSGSVQLVGVVAADELNRIQAEADIFVAPGYEEPWAIRINEALQSGCPVVLSDRIGAAELVRASGGGMTFRSGNVDRLTEALFELLTQSEKLKAMKKKVIEYRPRLHPREPARYLSDIIFYVIDGATRPCMPVWLRGPEYGNSFPYNS